MEIIAWKHATWSYSSPTMRVASHHVAVLGEGPLWHRGDRVVYWVDILGSRVLGFDPGTGDTTVVLDGTMVTALAETTESGLALVANRAIELLSDGDRTTLSEVDLPDEVRTNDGKCGPDGRLWFGTMDLDARRPLGELMVFDGSLRRVFDAVTISNGLGWSSTGEVFYHVDSVPGLIYQHRYDVISGAATERRVLVDLTSERGNPDGMAVDRDGNLWVAMWDGWAVFVFDPRGKKIDEMRLPVQRPTSVAFGGPNLSDLYITTATFELTPAMLDDQPQAGMLLVTESGTSGLPIGRFPIGEGGVH